MKIVLIGYMGSGKSSIGIELSSILGYKFVDIDSYIEKKEKQSISSIFKTKGEIYFRKVEKVYLDEVLNDNSSLIIATGGGTPCYGTIMNELKKSKDVITIYLQTGLEELTKRLYIEKEKRPLISHLDNKKELQDFIRKHLFERSYYYNQSDKKVVTDGFSVREISKKIVLQLF
ncbi:shikimate kinase [Patiriisocius hiemis]|uniref:Shikimate kinase n=1 Tax=Patiriisocius hiemis TaxID=3075604 RepID=A0ABU2YC37_9FLAO|nr:shikimate kinase [Constantimarinum sp. W242]MDT0555726.1 shikimate kinase [Constantimarinum sp. W242]